jgi:hypothetical protein
MAVLLSRDVPYGDRACDTCLVASSETNGWERNVAFDVDTIVYAIGGVLVGFHACIFALIAKIFGISEGFCPETRE